MRQTRVAALLAWIVIGGSACVPWTSSAPENEPKLISKDPRNSLVVFVHGFIGHYETTWGQFPGLLFEDPISPRVDVVSWGFPSPPILPALDIPTLAKQLKTVLDTQYSRHYDHIYLVGHSMGGTIIQTMVVDALLECRASDLQNLRHIFLFATPVDGVQVPGILAALNVHIRDLRPTSEVITRNRRIWVNRVYNPDIQPGQESCYLKIPTTVVVGAEDTIVTKESVFSYYQRPEPRVVPGDHWSLKSPKNREALAYQIVKSIIAETEPPLLESSILRINTELQRKALVSIGVRNPNLGIPVTVVNVEALLLSLFTGPKPPVAALKPVPSLSPINLGALIKDRLQSALESTQLLEIPPRGFEAFILPIESVATEQKHVYFLRIVFQVLRGRQVVPVPMDALLEVTEDAAGTVTVRPLTIDELRAEALSVPDAKKGTVEPLLRGTKSKALAALGDKKTVEGILLSITRGQYELLADLRSFEYDDRMFDVLAKLLWHEDILIRWHVLAVLSRGTSVKVRKVLVEYLANRDEWERLLVDAQVNVIVGLAKFRDRQVLEAVFSKLSEYHYGGRIQDQVLPVEGMIRLIETLTRRTFLPAHHEGLATLYEIGLVSAFGDREHLSRYRPLETILAELEDAVSRCINWWGKEGQQLRDDELLGRDGQ